MINRNNLYGSQTPEITTNLAEKTNQLISDLIGNTPVTISPVKITPPDLSKYVTPEKFKQVTDEYDSQILHYQKQAAERDQAIEDMKNERATPPPIED